MDCLGDHDPNITQMVSESCFVPSGLVLLILIALSHVDLLHSCLYAPFSILLLSISVCLTLPHNPRTQTRENAFSPRLSFDEL